MPNTGYTQQSRLARAKAHEFSLVSNYKLGYRHREDITNLPPGVLIVGSQNVVTNVSERVQIRQGYALDGDKSDVISTFGNSFDWITKINGEVHLRVGGLTSAGNDGKMQYRYVNSSGVVTWRDLITSISNVNYNFTKFWDTTEELREALFVNGQPQIQAWNGAVTTIASATSNTITKNGTDSWLDAGFYSALSGRSIVINGNVYTYSGGEDTTTLTGVSGSPLAEPADSIAHQSVVTTLNSDMSGITSTFANGLISVLNNQIFVGALNSSVVWISKVNDYTDYTSSTPRQTGEGASLILDDNIVAFEPQESYMYVSAGKDLWYNVNFEVQTSTVGVTYEQVNAEALKTGRQQGAKTQAFVSHMKNNIIMVTNEPTIDLLGRIENYFGTPQTKNVSDPIKLDVDNYDFTGGSIFYWRYYILVAIPVEGLVLMYNLATNSWEAPQQLPISRFYIVDGDLYGHSSQTFESYHVFTGYADRVYPGFNGHPIDAKWRFSYQNYGTRFSLKKANAFYVEGYISENTNLQCFVTYELDGCALTKNFTISGSDKQVVCISDPAGSLGKESLGKTKLGGAGSQSLTQLPPKFRAIPTFDNRDFFESSVSFEVLGTDQRMELLAFGLNVSGSSQEPVSIKQ